MMVVNNKFCVNGLKFVNHASPPASVDHQAVDIAFELYSRARVDRMPVKSRSVCGELEIIKFNPKYISPNLIFYSLFCFSLNS